MGQAPARPASQEPTPAHTAAQAQHPPHTGQLEVEIEKDVTYGPSAQNQQSDAARWKLDVYRPKNDKGKGRRAAVIFFHGGAWRAGNKEQFVWYATDAATLGYVAFSANYRLAPQHPYPAALDDAQRVVRWVRANAKNYGVDAKRIAVVGASAGGHLVLLLGSLDARDNGDPQLKRFSSRPTCVVDYFGPTDFEAYARAGAGESRSLVDFLGKPYKDAPEVWADASPITHVSKKSAPLIAIHGTADNLVPVAQSQALVDKQKAAGVEASLVILEGAPHGFRLGTEDAKRAWKASVEFLNRCLQLR